MSLDVYLKGKLGNHSANRVSWVSAKKKAASKNIDPDAAFKKVKGELGSELDRLTNLVEGAKKFVKAYPAGLDAGDKKLIQDQADKCTRLILDYEKVCTNQAKTAGLSPAKQDAWKDLYDSLRSLEAHVDKKVREAL
jgi:hypothetical protein